MRVEFNYRVGELVIRVRVMTCAISCKCLLSLKNVRVCSDENHMTLFENPTGLVEGWLMGRGNPIYHKLVISARNCRKLSVLPNSTLSVA